MVNNLMHKYDCIMAHCFTMDSLKGDIYQRLSHSIRNTLSNELCACTIHLGDLAFTNYYGGIGLIIKNPNIVFCSPQDVGKYRLQNNDLTFNDEIGKEHPTIADIENAILNRDKYNEFIVNNYTPIGIFISTDSRGWLMATQTIKNDFQTFHENTRSFSPPYFYFDGNELTEVIFDVNSSTFIQLRKCNLKSL